MKKTKVAAVAAAALIAATTVGAMAGCGGNSEHTIKVFLLANNAETKFYQQYFDEMEQELQEEGLDYKIVFNGEQEGNYYDALKSDINGGGIPDIFYIRPNEIYQYKDHIACLQDFADTRAAAYGVDLSDVYDTALDLYRYNPTTGELGNPSDKLYAFPKDLSTQQLGYNKQLLEKYQTEIRAAGYDLPWEMDFTQHTYTWEQYLGICKTIYETAKAKNDKVYASDVPPIEVLAHSFGGELIDLSGGRANGKVASLTDGAMKKAIEYQAKLCACGGADVENATYANMTAGKVCFYGLVGSWEIGEYNKSLNGGDPTKENWCLMPWPTDDGEADWQGVITSAGYCVSKKCAEQTEKAEVAMRIAISFLSPKTQDRLTKEAEITLPLLKSVSASYRDPENDTVFFPKTRGYFLDVVSGEHGFFPAKYSTYDSVWLTDLETQLSVMHHKKDKALDSFNSIKWENLQKTMQTHYDETKSR